LIALQTETTVLVAKAIILLHNYLRQNYAHGLPCIINRMANIDV